MKNEKYIPVSVISTEEVSAGKTEKVVWWMKGAGIVRAPLDFVYAYASDFSALEKMKDHFEAVKWDKLNQNLEFIVLSFGKKMPMKLHFWESKEGLEVRRLHFKLLEGPFAPSEGALLFNATAQQYTEVALVAIHEGNLLIFGSSLMSVAVESVLQHMAESLRLAAEQAWQKKQAKVSSSGI